MSSIPWGDGIPPKDYKYTPEEIAQMEIENATLPEAHLTDDPTITSSLWDAMINKDNKDAINDFFDHATREKKLEYLTVVRQKINWYNSVAKNQFDQLKKLRLFSQKLALNIRREDSRLQDYFKLPKNKTKKKAAIKMIYQQRAELINGFDKLTGNLTEFMWVHAPFQLPLPPK